MSLQAYALRVETSAVPRWLFRQGLREAFEGRPVSCRVGALVATFEPATSRCSGPDALHAL